MKKLLFILLVAATAALAGCAVFVADVPRYEVYPDHTEPPLVTADRITEPPEETTALPEPKAPELPEFYFFSDNGAKTFEKLTGYAGTWVWGKDIGCFGVVPDTGDMTGTEYSDFWNRAYEKYPDLKDCKLGYRLVFSTFGGRSFDVTILEPDDVMNRGNDAEESFREFVEVYLYDDIHKVPKMWEGSDRYSHLEQSTMTDEILITSIKLTGALYVTSVKDLSLYAFVYDSPDDFDAAGHYTGKNVIELVIE